MEETSPVHAGGKVRVVRDAPQTEDKLVLNLETGTSGQNGGYPGKQKRWTL